MDSTIKLFKTEKGHEQYYAAYDASLQLWPVAHESHFITTPYGQTHILTCGSQDAYPLVLLHAGQASSTMWYSNIAELSEKFQVFAMDTIGEPSKSIPARAYATFHDSAAWIEGVMDELGISKAHVMGLSRGGWLALNLAMQAPKRLERIVLLSPAASFVALNSFFSAIVQAVMHIPSRSVAKMALKSWVAHDFTVNEKFAEQFILGLQNWNWSVNKRGYSGMMPCTFSDEELSHIEQRTLMLIGDQDRLNPPKVLERAKGTINNLEGEIISNAGHFLNIEQPVRVNASVLKFLEEDHQSDKGENSFNSGSIHGSEYHHHRSK
jgi:pimeloyl-ACP methyl ester carboxylesterase